MDHWDEIRKLIEKRHADRLAERVKALDDVARADVAARLPALRKELRGWFDQWDDGLVDYAPVLRVAGAATFGGAAAVASWLYRRDFAPQWAGPDNDVDLILTVIADRPAAWRADLAERLTLRIRASDDRGMPLALALLRETGVEPPPHDPLVAGWVERGPSRLGDDPLLDQLLPRLFEAQGVGRVLQWEKDPGEGWLGALTELAEAGRVKREALIEGCVRRFLLGGTARDLRFFVHLHEALNPSPTETASRARDYLRLLPASPGPVAELAMKRLRACDDLGADDLAEAWDSLLFRSERKLVRAGLSWLDRSVRHTSALAGMVAAPLARAFGADSIELQETAVGLALAHAEGMSEEGRATVREAIELLAPEPGHRAAAVFGGSVAEAAPSFVPSLPDPAERVRGVEPPIETVEEFVRPSAEGTYSWQAWERLLAGFVTLASRDRAAMKATLRPLMIGAYTGAYHGESWERAEEWLQGAMHSLTATAPVRDAWRRFMPKTRLPAPHRLLLHRVAEILRAVEQDTLPPLLLATPTHSTGHVAAAELVRRLEVVEAAGAKPPAADLQQALLRLPRVSEPGVAERAARLTSAAGRIVAGWTCPEVEIKLGWTCGDHGDDHDWHDRGHHHAARPVVETTVELTGLPLVDLMLGVPRHSSGAQHSDWWASTLPSHREVAAASFMPYVLARHWGAPAIGPEQARALVRADGPAGAACAVVLARVLGDPRMPESVDVLLEAAARDELPASEIGRQAGLLVASGEVRMVDMVAALDAAARRGAHASVWRIAAAALPVLLPASGGRPHNGLAEFVRLAVVAAEWCGAHGEIPEVRDMAARKGNSGVLREIRRLHDRLTGGSAQEGRS
ncbi:DUF6493 family protein [Nonomuraea sp. 3-1Str]|uniref:DUF7824 domain-containing protein n=1 Tax=Nonomuraea sp. 3-1Str TaxID=2929801 RepID=UPI0028618809|nr:DUF6493 family protein [Nonomuraea sp. 3-1Str]MDR8411178.1 DUF6493 family protein [Nonomuraea sp. 3-1Str]